MSSVFSRWWELWQVRYAMPGTGCAGVSMQELSSIRPAWRPFRCFLRAASMWTALWIPWTVSYTHLVGVYSELPWEGELPELLVPCEKGGDGLLRPRLAEEGEKGDSGLPECGIVIAAQPQAVRFPVTCRLIPKDLTVGIGCRKGRSGAEISEFLQTV